MIHSKTEEGGETLSGESGKEMNTCMRAAAYTRPIHALMPKLGPDPFLGAQQPVMTVTRAGNGP